MEGQFAMLTLDDAQAAAVLAGLRLLQRQGCPPDLVEVATNCGRFGLPSDAFLDALCERVNAWGGEISNWNTGVEDGNGGQVPPDTRPYTVTHLHPVAAVRIEIGCGAPPGQAGGDTWIVDIELAGGRPVVRLYEPRQDEPAATFRFAAISQLGLSDACRPAPAARTGAS